MAAPLQSQPTADPLSLEHVPEKHLIIPSMPTPNGRLHLGHIAGPFLRADVLSRHRRRSGDHVRVISGFDSFESYMTLQAARENCRPKDCAERYSEGILRDFEAMDISIDRWIDPLDPEWSERYAETHRSLMNALLASKSVQNHLETVAYLPSTGRYVLGCWLLGRCPECGEEAGGYSCEACGANFQPWQMPETRPRPPVDEEPLSRRFQTPFLIVEDDERLSTWLDKADLDDDVRRRVSQAFAGRPYYVRLAAPGEWGVSWPILEEGKGEVPAVLFTYTFNAAYCLLIGDVYREIEAIAENPFDATSSVKITATFGMDVTMTKLINVPAALLSLGKFRPFDRAAVNRFYRLSGEKFSTSRRHAIWVEDITSRTPANSDVVRFHLVRTSPGREATNFEPKEFLQGTQELALRVGGPLATLQRIASSTAPSDPPSALVDLLNHELALQTASLDREPAAPEHLAASILRWSDAGHSLAENPAGGNDAFWWIKGLALLAYPVMPKLAIGLWQGLGHQGEPRIAEWPNRTSPTGSWPTDPFPTLSESEFAPCLPAKPASV